MKKDIESYHLILDQIDIREVYYNEDYETAINQKKLEEQKALTLIEITKQKKELEAQALIDKNIAITQAEAEAEVNGKESTAPPAALPTPSEPKKSKPVRHQYGRYGWVKLSDEEYSRLLNDLGEAEVKRCIEYVDESAQSTGNKK